IYLDCAATSLQKPRTVAIAMNNAMANMASPGRGCHRPAMLAADCVLDCRMRLASYFNVSEPENVIFTFNATHALNIAINSLVKPGDSVVISGYEHNAVVRPLAALNAKVRVAASPLFEPKLALAAFRQALPGAKCAVCTHVSNVFGYILPIDEISALCRKMGVPLIIDASQSAGALPIDFKALDAAFIAMPGHKSLLGPQGTGVLLCNRPTKPLLFGGTGGNSATKLMPDYLPDRLEAGTHNVAGIAGLAEGVKFVMSRPNGTILAYERGVCSEFAGRLQGFSGLRLYYSGGSPNQTGLVSAVCDKMGCDELAEKLGRAGVCVRAGLHCAPCAHETVGTMETGTVRFSFSPFITPADAGFAAETVKKVLNNV
ncbi:MAG: aminotransferase class V-fold PLP-dependent enzyme, partial [Oscillospiraceae bacterium]